jgi:ATP-dependent DNA helicase RecQ
VGLGLVDQKGNEYPILKLNAASWEVMKDQRTVRLRYVPQESATGAGSNRAREGGRKSKTEAASWEGVDRELFEFLRKVRLDLATSRAVPPYLILGDATLRELARVRPSSLEGLGTIYGIGEAKFADFAKTFFAALDSECQARRLTRDNRTRPTAETAADGPSRPAAAGTQAVALFRKGVPIDEVVRQTGRARSTTVQYLCDFLRAEAPQSVAAWVSNDVYQQVAEVASRVGADKLKPIFEALAGRISYDEIRIVMTHLAAHGA